MAQLVLIIIIDIVKALMPDHGTLILCPIVTENGPLHGEMTLSQP